MRYTLLALLLVACMELPTGITDQLDSLTDVNQVASVTCTADGLSIAVQAVEQCDAFNLDGTRINFNGFSPVVWASSQPTAISVTTAGLIRAETVVSDSVLITAAGTNGSSAGFVVRSVP